MTLKLKTTEDVKNWIFESNIIENTYKPIIAKEFERLKVDGAFFTNMEFFLAKNRYGFDSMLRDKFNLYDPFILQQLKTAILTKDMESSLKLLEIDKENIYKVENDELDVNDAAEIIKTLKESPITLKRELVTVKKEEQEEEEEEQEKNLVVAIKKEEGEGERIYLKKREKPVHASPYRQQILTQYGKKSIPLTKEMIKNLKTYVETIKYSDMFDEMKSHEIVFKLCQILGRRVNCSYNRITTTGLHRFCFKCQCSSCMSYCQKTDVGIQKLNILLIFSLKTANENPTATLPSLKSFEKYACCNGTEAYEEEDVIKPVFKKRKVVDDDDDSSADDDDDE